MALSRNPKNTTVLRYSISMPEFNERTKIFIPLLYSLHVTYCLHVTAWPLEVRSANRMNRSAIPVGARGKILVYSKPNHLLVVPLSRINSDYQYNTIISPMVLNGTSHFLLSALFFHSRARRCPRVLDCCRDWASVITTHARTNRGKQTQQWLFYFFVSFSSAIVTPIFLRPPLWRCPNARSWRGLPRLIR